jgi:predicted ATPase
MAHFSRLCLKNFKVFKNFTEFELAPITVLTGTNNSGKSSVFKALALLTESAGKNNLEKLEFIGNSSTEENFTTTKNRNSKNKRITTDFCSGFCPKKQKLRKPFICFSF